MTSRCHYANSDALPLVTFLTVRARWRESHNVPPRFALGLRQSGAIGCPRRSMRVEGVRLAPESLGMLHLDRWVAARQPSNGFGTFVIAARARASPQNLTQSD